VNFASDNNAGICPEVLEAIVAEAPEVDAAYGWDRASARLERVLVEVFEHDVWCLPVITGTAANSLALAATNPVWGAVSCHELAHIVVDECGAVTVAGSGLSLDPLPGEHGRLTAQTLDRRLRTRRDSGVHTPAATGLSLTQATEAGTVYRPDEVAALAAVAHERDMVVHMDGARFANAVATIGATPAELTWRAGVDVLCLGATKGGALGAEVVVGFDRRRLRDDPERLRKRMGHLLSKQRFASAQLVAWLAEGTWLRHARHANAMAASLAEALVAQGVHPIHPVEANMVWVHLESSAVERARRLGASFYVESEHDDGTQEARLVTSWATTSDEVDSLVRALSQA